MTPPTTGRGPGVGLTVYPWTNMGDPLNGWSTYFQEISRLLEDAERQYGVANNNLTDYIIGDDTQYVF